MAVSTRLIGFALSAGMLPRIRYPISTGTRVTDRIAAAAIA